MAIRVRDSFARQRLHASRWLGIDVEGRARIRIVRNRAGIQRPGAAPVPKWAVAACWADGEIDLRLDRVDRTPRTSLRLVLAHETVHHVLTYLGGVRLPRWFEEGLCVFHAGAPYFEPDTRLERLAAAGDLPALSRVDADFEKDLSHASVAYKVGESAVTYFIATYGNADLRALLRAVGGGASFPDAFREATGADLDEFETRWRRSVTPRLPYLLYVLLENIDLTLMFFGALVVVLGYVRWRMRRERALRSLSSPPVR